ncbi:MAG: glycosyltransferase family 39 protein [Patescibacteria group bacterium]|jgi:hypothetical protein
MSISKTYQFLLTVIFFIFLIFIHNNHVLDSDEGVVLDGAWNIINGRLLYIDFFHLIAPGSFFLIFIVWKIFGVSYLLANLFSIVVLFLAIIGLYKISKLLINNWLAYLTPIAYGLMSFYWPLINHNSYNIVLIIWAIYFLIKAFDDQRCSNFLLAGSFSGLSILFLQSKGAMFFIGITGLLFILKLINKVKIKNVVYYFLSGFIISWSVLIFWPLDIIYRSLVVVPVSNYTSINHGSLFFLLLIIIWLVVLAWFYRREKNFKIIFLFFVQLLLLLISFYKLDYYNISIVSFPLLILTSLFFTKIKKYRQKLFFAIFSLIIFFILMIPSFVYIVYHRPPFGWPDSIIKYTQENCPGQYLYAGPFLPGVYFETGKLNPGPYYSLFTSFNTDSQFQEQAMAIEKYKPTCAILNYNIVSKFNYNLNNPVDQYILQNYNEVTTEFNNINFYKINNNF